jgi:hypothetical protein
MQMRLIIFRWVLLVSLLMKRKKFIICTTFLIVRRALRLILWRTGCWRTQNAQSVCVTLPKETNAGRFPFHAHIRSTQNASMNGSDFPQLVHYVRLQHPTCFPAILIPFPLLLIPFPLFPYLFFQVNVL